MNKCHTNQWFPLHLCLIIYNRLDSVGNCSGRGQVHFHPATPAPITEESLARGNPVSQHHRKSDTLQLQTSQTPQTHRSRYNSHRCAGLCWSRSKSVCSDHLFVLWRYSILRRRRRIWNTGRRRMAVSWRQPPTAGRGCATSAGFRHCAYLPL